MKALASFIMQSRSRAVAVTAGFGVGGLVLPPIGILGSAAIGLVALRVGFAQAGMVAVIAAVVLGVLAWGMGSNPMVGVAMGLVQWLPVMVLADVLRRTMSWSSMLLTAAGIGCLAIVMTHVMVTDVVGMWVSVLQATLGPVFEQTGRDPVELEETFRQIAPFMSGMLAAAMILSLALAMVIARYWQSVLYNPGGFAEEFQRLQLGRIPALVLVGLILGAWLGQSSLSMELALVFVVVFFLQGIALVHATTRGRGMSRFWLVGMYVLLVVAMPQMMMMIAAFGVIDSVMDFRRRLGNRSGPDGV